MAGSTKLWLVTKPNLPSELLRFPNYAAFAFHGLGSSPLPSAKGTGICL